MRLRLAEARRGWSRSESHGCGSGCGWRSTHAGAALGPLEAHLAQLSPLKILERGYAIVTRDDEREGKLVKSPEDAPAGTDVRVRLAKGELRGRVLPDKRRERVNRK